MQINHIPKVVTLFQHTGQPVFIKKLCFLKVSGFEGTQQESTCQSLLSLTLNHLVSGELQL